MNKEPRFDVAVIGAGPAGASAAFHLSEKGWHVALLERMHMPRVKACGDGLGTGSVAMLEKMGLGPRLGEFHAVRGVEVLVHGKSSCVSQFRSPAGESRALVIPRSELDWLIVQRAMEAGCAWYPGCRVTGFEFEQGRIQGVRYVADCERTLRARFVVIADGGRSTLCTQAGIPAAPVSGLGYAVRGYFSGATAEKLFQIFIPLTDPQTGRALRGYGWVFPLNDRLANIGVGFHPGEGVTRRLNLRNLFREFLGLLRSSQPGMAEIRCEGEWIGGLLNSGLEPSRCAANGAVLVGDAAGLVDPFTGEGIDTALVSGQLAAEAMEAALVRDDLTELNSYSRRLAERYRDRFQMGDRFAKTYAFMWKVVQHSKDQRGPLFNGMLRALFSYNDDSKSFPSSPTNLVDAFRRRVQIEMNAIAGDEFPILARIAFRMQDNTAARLRQAVGYWAYCLSGAKPDHNAVTLSGCLELAKLAHDVQAQVIATCGEATARDGESNRWANSFAVMTGNYLLTKAFSAARRFGPDLTKMVANTAARVCGLEITVTAVNGETRPRRRQRLSVKAEIEGLFCGLSGRLAAHHAGLPRHSLDLLDSFGKSYGAALFLHRQRSEPSVVEPHTAAAMSALADLPDSEAKSELINLAAGVANVTDVQ
jgi:geranylgeranyl reductase family protein